MKIPHDKFCVLPWISLEASPIGTVRPCCLAEDEIVDSNSVKFNLATADLRAVQNSEYMYQLRQAFLAEQRPATCRKCWQEEDAGRTSKRMHTLDRLKHMIGDEPWDHHARPLMFLDLKLGNICNLKCRICGSWSSSTFATEEVINIPDPAYRKSSFHYQMLKKGAWPRENRVFWDQVDSMLEQIRYIEFTGGEPFMIQEHFDMLQGIVDRGYAGNVEIHYNTNGTIFPAGAEEIWRNFRHVEIAFSIDDVGKRFEYQRSGAEWLMVNAHIDQFREMRNRNSNITLQVCTTVNAFNVMYLEDVAAWIDQQAFDFVYWNMLHDGPQFCVANLPQSAKDLACERLQLAKFSARNRLEIDRIIEFMRQGTQDLGRELCDSIRQVDQRRNQDIRTVAPELAASIGYEA